MLRKHFQDAPKSEDKILDKLNGPVIKWEIILSSSGKI